jgi:hypothetical protein
MNPFLSIPVVINFVNSANFHNGSTLIMGLVHSTSLQGLECDDD